MSRTNEIRVRLSDDELQQLDEQRPGEMPRAVYLRSLIHKPPEVGDVATRTEALGNPDRDGARRQVTPAVELAKLLKGDNVAGAGRDDPLGEVDQIFRTKANGEGAAT